MYVKGVFQAKKLTKTVGKNNQIYRTLWVVDQFDEEYGVSVENEVIPKLKRNGLYEGIFDFQQRDRYEGYGKVDNMTLVDVIEADPKNWAVTGTWDI